MSNRKKARCVLIEPLEARQLLSVTVPNGYMKITDSPISIDSSSDAPVETGITLQSGIKYFFVASGTHQVATHPDRQSDAQFYEEAGDLAWIKSSTPRLRVTGVGSWGSVFASDHEYGATITGNGSELAPWIYDTRYQDNSGSLDLDVYEQVQLNTLTVNDSNKPDNTVTVSDSNSQDLAILQDSAGNATIDIAGEINPDESDAREHVLWDVREKKDNSIDYNGTFNDEPSGLVLTPSADNHAFVVQGGFDNNDDGTLDPDEVTRTVNVYVIPNKVNSTGDAGAQDETKTPWTGGFNSEGAPEVTLRSLIQYDNAASDPLGINFNIPTSDPGHNGSVWNISTSGEPTVTTPITIDGTTQPGAGGTPVVVLNGSGTGLDFQADGDVSAKGLGFTSFNIGISDTSGSGDNSFTNNSFNSVTTGISLDLSSDATGEVEQNQINAQGAGLDATTALEGSGSLMIQDNTFDVGQQGVMLDASNGGDIEITGNTYDGNLSGSSAVMTGAIQPADDSADGPTAFVGNLDLTDPYAVLNTHDNTYTELAGGFSLSGTDGGTINANSEDVTSTSNIGGNFDLNLGDSGALDLTNVTAGDQNRTGPLDGFKLSLYGTQSGGQKVNLTGIKTNNAVAPMYVEGGFKGDISLTQSTLLGGPNVVEIASFHLTQKVGVQLDGVHIQGTGIAANNVGLGVHENYEADFSETEQWKNVFISNVFQAATISVLASSNTALDLEPSAWTVQNVTSGGFSFTANGPGTSSITANLSASNFLSTGQPCNVSVNGGCKALIGLFGNNISHAKDPLEIGFAAGVGDQITYIQASHNTFSYFAGPVLLINLPRSIPFVGNQITLQFNLISNSGSGLKWSHRTVSPDGMIADSQTTIVVDPADDSSGPPSLIEDNTFTDITGSAIELDDGLNDQVDGNTMTNCGGGIDVEGDSGPAQPNIFANNISGSAGHAIAIYAGTGAIINGNTITGNATGIFVNSSEKVSIYGNTLSGNGMDIDCQGNVYLVGGTGSDALAAGSGDDSLDGAEGNDTLFGGVGADTFIFDADSGADVVQDFAPGMDKLDLRSTAVGGLQFGDLNISQDGSDTVIDLLNGNSIRLTGVTATSLSANDVILS